MAFESFIGPNEPIIGDGCAVPILGSTGLELPEHPDYSGVAEPFPSELLIPESEWWDWIEEKEARKQQLSDLIRLANLPHKDQGQTNFCWINSPVHCLEIVRLAQNQPTVILSPASAGAPIKNFRNQGGWGREGLEWMIEHGVCPVENWPANAIDRRYWTEENRAIALNYRPVEWWVLKPRSIKELVSCLLRNIPVALGYNWWGHEVTGCDAIWVNGRIAIRIRNSWKNWGDFGFGILEGSKMLPDDAVAPRTAIPYSREV